MTTPADLPPPPWAVREAEALMLEHVPDPRTRTLLVARALFRARAAGVGSSTHKNCPHGYPPTVNCSRCEVLENGR